MWGLLFVLSFLSAVFSSYSVHYFLFCFYVESVFDVEFDSFLPPFDYLIVFSCFLSSSFAQSPISLEPQMSSTYQTIFLLSIIIIWSFEKSQQLQKCNLCNSTVTILPKHERIWLLITDFLLNECVKDFFYSFLWRLVGS